MRRRFVSSKLTTLAHNSRLHAKVAIAFHKCLADNVTHSIKTLAALRDWLTSNTFSWYSDLEAATNVRDNLAILGLQGVLNLALERAVTVHIERQARKMLHKRGTVEPGDLYKLGDMETDVGAVNENSEAVRPLLVKLIYGPLSNTFAFWSADQESAGFEASLTEWQGRCIYHLDTLLVREKADGLLSLIKEWPASMAAMSDLKEAITETRDKVLVADRLNDALKKNLLHPGAKTRDILQTYVSLVYAVRYVDPSGILLSRVSGPIRKYLRGRPDTVPVIVASLLGDDEGFVQLREELDAAGKGEAAGASQNDGDTSMIVGADKDEDEGEENAGGKGSRDGPSSIHPVDYTDPNWEPRPVDAGPSYRQSRTADVIAMLVSIFDDKQSFVKALEVSTAKALLKTSNYDITREYRNNAVLKRRFGDTSLARCDVMLQDIVESRRVDASIRRIMDAPSSALPMATQKKLGLSKEEGASHTFAVLRPLITSRQFWPDLEGSEVPMAPGGVPGESNQPATLASVGPPPGGMDMKLPGELGVALDTYNRAFTAVRDSRRLRWLPGFGRVKVQISMIDGRRWTEIVDPIKAAVLTAASTTSSPTSPLSKAQLALDMGLSESSKELTDALRYWCSKSVLVEVEGRPGWFIECDTQL